MFDWVLIMPLTCLKKTLTPNTNANIQKEVFSSVQNYDLKNIEWRPSRVVSKKSCSGNHIYILKYMVELSYHKKDKIHAKYL